MEKIIIKAIILALLVAVSFYAGVTHQQVDNYRHGVMDANGRWNWEFRRAGYND